MKTNHVSKKLFFAILLTLFALPAFSAKDDTDYELLAQVGTFEEIETALKRNSSLKGQVFGQDRETFMMLCLKANRSAKIIDLCLKAECNVNAKTKSKKTVLMYAAQYCSDTGIVETLIKEGKLLASSMKKRVLEKDAEGKTAFDYALLNVQANTYEILSHYAQDPAGNADQAAKPADAGDEEKVNPKATAKEAKLAEEALKKAKQETEKAEKLAREEAEKAAKQAEKEAREAEKKAAAEAKKAEKEARRKKLNPDAEQKTRAEERATSVNSTFVVPQKPIDDEPEEETKVEVKPPVEEKAEVKPAVSEEKTPAPAVVPATEEEATTVRPASATYNPNAGAEKTPEPVKNTSQSEDTPKLSIKENESTNESSNESDDEESTYASLRDGTTKRTSKIVMPEVQTQDSQLQQQKLSETNTQKSSPAKSTPLASPLPRKEEVKPYTQSFLYDFVVEEDNEDENEEIKKRTIENPDAADANGVTLLMKAAKAGNDWDVRNLLENGANVQLRDKDGWSALMYAVRYQNSMQLVNMLVSHGAHIRVRNKYNATPLLLAADYSQNPEILSLLLRNRSSSEDEVFKAFIFALTSNVGQDHVKTAKIQLFLDMDIPLNRIWKGKTPLMYACQYASSNAVIKQLLDAGARPGIQDANGKTAFDYAKLNTNLVRDDIYWSLNSSAR